MIALIAGTGTLPSEACKKFLLTNQDFFIISLFPEDNFDALNQLIKGEKKIFAESFYKPSQIIRLLHEQKTTKALLIGKVDKQHLLKKIKLDWLGVKMLSSVLTKSDSNIMERILAEFEKHNIQVMHQDEVLDALLVPPGVLTGKLTPELEENSLFGLKTALILSANDIGQTVVVKDTMVLAVEAIEGTDACIQRGIQLGKTDIIVCKAAQPNQNKKFDLPTLGLKSLIPLKKGDVKVIAWLASHTLIAQKEAFIKKADELAITLYSVDIHN
jgi:UDP-2,3-diacylglucosamine hydrolase